MNLLFSTNAPLEDKHHASAVLNHQGFSYYVFTPQKTLMYHLKSQKWSSEPSNLNFIMMGYDTVNQHQCYFFGGYNPSSGAVSSKLLKYDSYQGSLEPVSYSPSQAPAPRLSCSLTFVPPSDGSHPGSLYVFGGMDAHQNTLNDLYRFDLYTKTWEIVKNKSDFSPRPRQGHTLLYWKRFNRPAHGPSYKHPQTSASHRPKTSSFLVLFGGFSGGKSGQLQRLADVWLFDLGIFFKKYFILFL
jgi:hypothetical protein